MTLASLLLAVLAAGCNAVSSVMQRKANLQEPPSRRFGVHLLWRVVRQPSWGVGIGALIASFALQATALGLGTLSTVEPVLAVELPMTLFLGAWTFRHPLGWREYGSAAAMAAGLAVFVVAIGPSGGDAARVSGGVAGIAAAATLAAIIALVVVAERGAARARPALLGAAAGAMFGLTASLMKIAVAVVSRDGFAAVLRHWELYGMGAFGITSLVLVQAALHAGTLVAVQPGLTLMDPLVSVAWGTLLLGEASHRGPVLLLAPVGAAIIVAAVLVLARSPALSWLGPGSG